MLRRIAIILLILGLAVPAAAMPVAHHAPQVSAEHHHHGQPGNPAPAPAKAKHECIGCIAPLDRAPAPLAGPPLRAALARPALADELPETRAGPDTPPPRA